MGQFYICNPEDIRSKLKTLDKTRTSKDGWVQYYSDKNNNEEWLLTQHDSEYHGGGVSILKRLPQPATDELIDIALISTDKNDITGASLELSDREKYNKEEFRDKMIQRLLEFDLSGLSDFDKDRLRIIIYESDLYDPTNRKNIVGKHLTEIQKDSEYYQLISNKAKAILNEIGK